jgi:hypothetical protein
MTWHRVFTRSDSVPNIDALRQTLHVYFPELEGAYRYDDSGWTECTFQPLRCAVPWKLSRYTREDDDIRGDLQAWAAWLETCTGNPHRQMLMEHMIATQQVFTFERVEGLPEEACVALCRFLATNNQGVYQIDGQGIFAADGNLLIQGE